MPKPGSSLAIIAVLAFAAYLLWSTLASQRDECRVCVEFNGRTNCATASAASAAEAERSAQTTACGPLTSGMNEGIACSRRKPLSATCRRR
jgi:hypothetical protein